MGHDCMKTLKEQQMQTFKRALEKLKDLIKEALVLKYYDNKHKSNMFMGASQENIGTTLSQ